MTGKNQTNSAQVAAPKCEEKRQALRIKVGQEPVKRPALPCATLVY